MINHSLWFSQGSFHTNTIEGVWSRLERLTNDFCRIDGYILNKFIEKGINVDEFEMESFVQDYFLWNVNIKN